ncbi:hypothetical protein BMS3Abin02_02144 [bacterium BMS3Abin02]|nr:hypothetical protein BMS3Abin02_02144 [bacterium BMS3Abin02]GBE20989.1 hypothetical protein BMS3Bbin01_00330 [bacterium BMS3Bbin01]HDH26160.1 hypothetical protein [Actinomycetota bacterium]HDL49160.1 hypothetical protein [Actinomycetota bacterium]
MRALRPIAAVLLSFALVVGLAGPAIADALAAKVNAVRSPDLPILTAADTLAAQSAAAQAKAGKQFHTNLNPLLAVCSTAGEVVGVGPNLDSIFEAFRNSPLHWDLITSSRWTSMGTGMATTSDGFLYISVIFCEGADGDAPTQPAPSPVQTVIAPVQSRHIAPRPPAVPPVLKVSPCWGSDARRLVLHEPPWITGSCPGLA